MERRRAWIRCMEDWSRLVLTSVAYWYANNSDIGAQNNTLLSANVKGVDLSTPLAPRVAIL